MISRLFRRADRVGRSGPDAGVESPRNEVSVGSLRADDVAAVFGILLARAPAEAERHECEKALRAGGTIDDLAGRVIPSPEFRLLYEAYKEGDTGDRRAGVVEELLAALGPDDAFVDRCYRLVFARDADPGGRAYYLQRLGEHAGRFLLLRGLIASDEFERRFRGLCPEAGHVPRDVQLCELANPAKWDNPEWRAILASLGEPADKLAMHRKSYEFTQMLFGLTRLGRLRDDAAVLSVGAGHEKPLYWLANRVRRVVATDLYRGEWQSAFAREGDSEVLASPEVFAPFPYPVERLVFLEMDGRRLAFADDSFDIVYSLSSIEHFGGLDGAQASVSEMARVLKPGGVLALATEYCLSGPPHHEAFQPHQVHVLASQPGLRLVQPIDARVFDRYEAVPVDLNRNRYQTPHMLVRDGESVFTSVMMFFEKGGDREVRQVRPAASPGAYGMGPVPGGGPSV